jgi:glycine/D-amino acid oxidase-like deaminating enzyme
MNQYRASVKPLWETDVLVVGSGSAGATAALAAARQGGSVALVERYGFVGGISTQVLDTFYGFFTPGPYLDPRAPVPFAPARCALVKEA